MTDIKQMFDESTVQQENQSVLMRVGIHGNRHEKVVTGVTVTNILAFPHKGVFGRCHIDVSVHQYYGPNPTEKQIESTIALIKTGENTWRVNG